MDRDGKMSIELPPCALTEGLRHQNAEPLERIVALVAVGGRDGRGLGALPIHERRSVALSVCGIVFNAVVVEPDAALLPETLAPLQLQVRLEEVTLVDVVVVLGGRHR